MRAAQATVAHSRGHTDLGCRDTGLLDGVVAQLAHTHAAKLHAQRCPPRRSHW